MGATVRQSRCGCWAQVVREVCPIFCVSNVTGDGAQLRQPCGGLDVRARKNNVSDRDSEAPTANTQPRRPAEQACRQVQTWGCQGCGSAHLAVALPFSSLPGSSVTQVSRCCAASCGVFPRGCRTFKRNSWEHQRLLFPCWHFVKL